jgi:hypothetical protein
MEKEIRDILNEKLLGNDINLSDTILSYLKSNCFICWKTRLENELNKAYCDVKTLPQLYMNVCDDCINYFNFKKCYKCKVWVDKSRCYIIGSLDNFYACQYCSCSGISDYVGIG